MYERIVTIVSNDSQKRMERNAALSMYIDHIIYSRNMFEREHYTNIYYELINGNDLIKDEVTPYVCM